MLAPGTVTAGQPTKETSVSRFPAFPRFSPFSARFGLLKAQLGSPLYRRSQDDDSDIKLAVRVRVQFRVARRARPAPNTRARCDSGIGKLRRSLCQISMAFVLCTSVRRGWCGFSDSVDVPCCVASPGDPASPLTVGHLRFTSHRQHTTTKPHIHLPSFSTVPLQ
ncbi:hypothetical protein CALVIDRAFT_415801 [Calocera viscosa TUFC12733]|uniref:Uncharacterized protein n=1 Tax=Calocera viscosa (strain TUFC12733) TaxID=1330018 RepID=A0A167G0H1_CALVF|nr:hypothetical protein CALVIDRAFT_415801 [Calocera viscosa TUFC12733]